MAKEKTVYVCSNCGQESPKWQGKCPACGQWNTFVEEIVRKEPVARRPEAGIAPTKAKLVTVDEIEAADEARIDLHDAELNRVPGGGQGALPAAPPPQQVQREPGAGGQHHGHQDAQHRHPMDLLINGMSGGPSSHTALLPSAGYFLR